MEQGERVGAAGDGDFAAVCIQGVHAGKRRNRLTHRKFSAPIGFPIGFLCAHLKLKLCNTRARIPMDIADLGQGLRS